MSTPNTATAELPEPDDHSSDGRPMWTAIGMDGPVKVSVAGSGQRVRVHVDDAYLTAGNAREHAAYILACAEAAEREAVEAGAL